MALREHFWLFSALVEREIRSRYVGSLGGFLWAVVQPLVLLGLYALLFRTIFQVRLPGNTAFIEFVAVLLWPWMAFQESVLRGAQAVRAHGNLVRKVAFPHELLVFSAISATFVVHTAGWLLVLGVLAAFGTGLSPAGLPVAGVALLVLLVLALGCGLFFAALQVFVPDVEQFLPPLFTALFYATPILYPMAMAPEWLQSLLAWNPMTHLLEPIRAGLLAGAPASAAPNWLWWLLVPAAFGAALAVFRRLSPHFEDYL